MICRGRRIAAWLGTILTLAGPAVAGSPPTPLRGENISGAELNGDKPSSRVGYDYVYPTDDAFRHAETLGMTVIRLPIAWERLQPRLNAALDPAELARLRAAIAGANAHRLALIIDIHNYGQYRGQPIGSSGVPVVAFADLWSRMAGAFRTDPGVVFGLMNEPHGITAPAWAGAAQAAITAIRLAGFRGLLLVSGTGWDGAHNFVSGVGYGAPNATSLNKLVDSIDNIAIEVHQYLDANFSGTQADCPHAAHVVELLSPMTAWLRQTRQRGFLGEVGVSISPECLAGLTAMLQMLSTNADVWLGWTYWAAGVWWDKNYMFSIEPRADGTEHPQAYVLHAFLSGH